jgi:hypothetical protein
MNSGAFENGSNRSQFTEWPVRTLSFEESVIVGAREPATTLRQLVTRLAAVATSHRIHVSPMSSEWLRTFEVECEKRRGDL